jgi:membrane protein DedA with SNARE-associated domain
LKVHSYLWVITVVLFVGGVGLPIPENPVLIGGGYAIHTHACPTTISLCLWFSAITSGDFFLFAVARWLFTRPTLLSFLTRHVGKKKKKLQTYQAAFANRACWTLFFARFTFGLRAIAYLAAGAARYN